MADRILAKGLYAKEIEGQYGKMTALTFVIKDFKDFLDANINEEGKCFVTLKTAKSGVVYGEIFQPKPKDPDGLPGTLTTAEDLDLDLPF